MAGPEKPPTLLARTGFLLCMSILMPKRVFIRESASAPPETAAFAISVISVTLGVSLTIRGFLQYFFTSETTFSAIEGTVPNVIPPWLTLGHEILSSNKSTSASESFSAAAQYSSIVWPHIFTIIFVSNCLKKGISFSIK